MNTQTIRKQRRAPLVALKQQLGIKDLKPAVQPVVAAPKKAQKTPTPIASASNAEFARTIAAHLAKQQQKVPSEIADLIKQPHIK
jgi:hypothetical protein